MVKTIEEIEHEKIGDIDVVKDDPKEDIEEILEEKEVLDTNLTD